MKKYKYYFNAKPDIDHAAPVVVNQLDNSDSATIVYPSFCITSSDVARNLARALIDAAHKMELIENGL